MNIFAKNTPIQSILIKHNKRIRDTPRLPSATQKQHVHPAWYSPCQHYPLQSPLRPRTSFRISILIGSYRYTRPTYTRRSYDGPSVRV